MNEHIYEQLRQAIDEVGVGFPKTASGVEIRMLKKLFSEEEAEMYMKLTDKLEAPDVIANRANQETEKVAAILKK